MFPQRLDSPLAYDIAKVMMDGFNRHLCKVSVLRIKEGYVHAVFPYEREKRFSISHSHLAG